MSTVSTMRLIVPPAFNPLPTMAAGCLLVDASDLNSLKVMDASQGYYFFGADAPTQETGLSKQWLTEIVVGKNQEEADAALIQAIRYAMANDKNLPQLRLSLAYNCTEGGLGTRIIRKDFKPDSLEYTWNYLVVEAKTSPNNTVLAQEIWLSHKSVLTPDLVDGMKTLGSGTQIDGKSLAARIANP